MNQVEQAAKLKIALRAKTDLFFLVKYILNSGDRSDTITEATHKEMCDYTSTVIPGNPATMPEIRPKLTEGGVPDPMSDQYDPQKNYLMLLLPRGTFKSSLVTVGFSLQFLLNNPNARILIDSETFAKAKAFLMEIKSHLESNEDYRDVFHTLYGKFPDANHKTDLWTNSELNISSRTQGLKEPTFSCSGVDIAKTGMHYDLIIMDDLHSENNVTTKEQLDKVKTHYKLALSLIDPGKPIIIIGTRWHYNDLYQHILDEERDNFNILIRKAYKPDGTLFFPEVLTETELAKRKKSMGSYHFSMQYMNEPIDDETATFKRSDIVRKKWELVKDRPINWYMSVDPSYEGPYSDFAALVVAGMDHQRDLYVRHVVRQKMTYAEIINKMFDLDSQFNPKQILLETIGTKSLEHELKNEQKRRGRWLKVTAIKSQPKSKEERIRGLAPYYEFGHIFHVQESPQLDDLEYELLHFPFGKHDDTIDALANILDVATPPNANMVSAEQKEKIKYVAYKPRSPVTGY